MIEALWSEQREQGESSTIEALWSEHREQGASSMIEAPFV